MRFVRLRRCKALICNTDRRCVVNSNVIVFGGLHFGQVEYGEWEYFKVRCATATSRRAIHENMRAV